MAKKDAKVVEMPKAEPQNDNRPSYDNLMQIANQLAQQNDAFRKRINVVEGELKKVADSYQRIVFLQETLRVNASYLYYKKGLFKNTMVNYSPFKPEDIQSYADELVKLINEGKVNKEKIEELLKPADNGNSEKAE